LKSHPARRTSITTLKKLADASVFLQLGRKRDDVIGVLQLGNVGLQVTQMLSERFGTDREKASRVCAREAANLLGVRTLRGFSSGERLAWRRWAPLVVTIPGIGRWPQQDKRALIEVIRAKGGTCELDYLHRFDQYRRLRRAIGRLAAAK
jgi:hypothetical protein